MRLPVIGTTPILSFQSPAGKHFAFSPLGGYNVRMDLTNAISAKQAAGLLGCDESQARRLLREGRIASIQFDGRRLTTEAAVRAYQPSERGRPRGKTSNLKKKIGS